MSIATQQTETTTAPAKAPWRTRQANGWASYMRWLNRQLAKLCERHGLPIHQVRVRRTQYFSRSVRDEHAHRNSTGIADLVNIETGAVVMSGFDPMPGAAEFKPQEAIFDLLNSQSDATAEEVDRLHELREARARELDAERRDFNWWQPYSITNHYGATNLPAIELGLEVAQRDVTDGELLRVYAEKREAFSRMSKENKRRAYSDERGKERYAAFKKLPRLLRLRVYRCVKCDGLDPATATLEQLEARRVKRTTGAMAAMDDSHAQRRAQGRGRKSGRDVGKAEDSRFAYKAPVQTEDGATTFDNKGKQDWTTAQRLGDWDADAPSFTPLTPAEHMAKIRAIKEAMGMRGGA